MKNIFHKRAPITLAVLLVSGSTLGASAARASSINLQTHEVTSNTSYALTEDALLQAAPGWSLWTGPRLVFSAEYNVLDKPLVQYSTDRAQQTGVVMDTLTTLDLQAGILPRPDLQLSVDLPLNLIKPTGQLAAFALGDMRLQGKWRLTGRDQLIAISVIPEMYLPTGNTDLLLSNSTFGGGLRVAFEKDFGILRAAANICYRVTPGAVYQNIDYSQQLPVSLGTYLSLGAGWGVNAEATSALALPFNRYNNPGEVYLGARYQVSREAVLLAGLSLGSLDPSASGDVRVIAGVKFTPMPELPAAKVDTVQMSRSAPVPVKLPRKAKSSKVKVKIKSSNAVSSHSKSAAKPKKQLVVAAPKPQPNKVHRESSKSSHDVEVEVTTE